MKRTVITVVGKDKVGIIAKFVLTLQKIKYILDISQTIIQEFFNMMMIVDTSQALKDFDALQDELDKIGEEIGVDIKAQHEDIFNKMHRI